MAITLVGTVTGNTTSSNTLTLPGTPAEDDLVIVFAGFRFPLHVSLCIREDRGEESCGAG